MPTYRWNPGTGELVEVTAETARQPQAFQIMPDLPAYRSPLGDGWVDGRAARREHLKRNNCREVDPSERPKGYRNPDFALKRGLPLAQD